MFTVTNVRSSKFRTSAPNTPLKTHSLHGGNNDHFLQGGGWNPFPNDKTRLNCQDLPVFLKVLHLPGPHLPDIKPYPWKTIHTDEVYNASDVGSMTTETWADTASLLSNSTVPSQTEHSGSFTTFNRAIQKVARAGNFPPKVVPSILLAHEGDDVSVLTEPGVALPVLRQKVKPVSSKVAAIKPSTVIIRAKATKQVFIKNRCQDRDVLCGRGGRTNQHPGNQQFHIEKDLLQRQYWHAADRKEKATIALALVNTMRHKYHSRFLAFCKQQQKWYLASDHQVLEKAKQVLREKPMSP